MGTRVVDRYGLPFETVEVRKRIGFLGGDHLPVDSGGEVTAPSFSSTRELVYSLQGFDDEEMKKK